jgi:hypothetical protein
MLWDVFCFCFLFFCGIPEHALESLMIALEPYSQLFDLTNALESLQNASESLNNASEP